MALALVSVIVIAAVVVLQLTLRKPVAAVMPRSRPGR
jgi:hypothetical protein